MKKLIGLFAFTLLFASILFAQQKVAVYATGGKEAGVSKVFADKLVEAFVKSGKYTAIERTSSFLNELKKEHEYQRTGEVLDSEISKIGKQFGVQLVCVAEITEVLGEQYVSARLINVESAEVIAASSMNCQLNNIDQLIAIAEIISEDLSKRTGKEQFAQEQDLIAQAERAEKQEELNESLYKLGESVGKLVVATNSGTIRFTNKCKSPYYVYIDGKYKNTVAGYRTLDISVLKGQYQVEVIQKSGYLLYRTRKAWTVNVGRNDIAVCSWE